MVVGSRNGLNVSYPLIKKIPKYFIIKLANYISGVKIPDINSGLRIFKKETAMHFFHLYPQGFSFTTTITMSMLCGGYDVEFVPIDYYEREGKSKIRPIRDTINFFTLLVKMAMYYNPFKFFAPITIIFAFISIFTVTKDFSRGDLSESSVLFPMATLLFLTLGLLADLIVKRSS